MLRANLIKSVIFTGFFASLLITPQSVQAAPPKGNMYAVVVKVSGDVKVLAPNQKSPIKITEKAKLMEGSKITLTKNSSMQWIKREYDQITNEKIIGPAEIYFPSKMSGRVALLKGQRSLGGVYRGDDDSTDIECAYPENIKIPQTKTALPFLQLTCNHSLRYPDIHYEIVQDGNKVKSGRFFDGFQNTYLKQGNYLITFYNKDSKLTESKLEVDSFDLDARLSELMNDKQKPNIPTDLIASLELCQLGYKYICEMNLNYRVILKDSTAKASKDFELTTELKQMLNDSLTYHSRKGD